MGVSNRSARMRGGKCMSIACKTTAVPRPCAQSSSSDDAHRLFTVGVDAPLHQKRATWNRRWMDLSPMQLRLAFAVATGLALTCTGAERELVRDPHLRLPPHGHFHRLGGPRRLRRRTSDSQPEPESSSERYRPPTLIDGENQHSCLVHGHVAAFVRFFF